MFNDIVQFLDSIKDTIMENIGLVIASLGAFGTTAWGFITNLKLKFSKKETATVSTENIDLKNRIDKLENRLVNLDSTIKEGFKTQTGDLATLGEGFNLLAQNSRAAGPETKAKLKNTITSLSGMTKDKIENVNLETQEILKQIEIPKEIGTLRNKIETAGHSILDKYLSEDAQELIRRSGRRC